MAKRKKPKKLNKKQPETNHWVIEGDYPIGVSVRKGKVVKVLPVLSYVKSCNA